ncbi:putative phospholipase B-like 2 [Polypterus senegalus]|uniref:putative phospholipase B-like 2 n=1 Tax=Polypterus senegalus TaxID=55291 RepID=UPI00196506BD|nr:putative phospholipase B-like 2 [Polypterus senegalus]
MAAVANVCGFSAMFRCAVLLTALLSHAQAEVASVVLDRQTDKLIVKTGFDPEFVAWANFTDDIQRSGWAYLEVTTSGRYNDSLQAYAAGAAEASLTKQLLYMHWMNTIVGYCGPVQHDMGYCQRLKDYIIQNLKWMETKMDSGEDPEYWHQVRLILLQLRGLEDSYNDEIAFPVSVFSINPFGFLLFQLGGDLEDLESALNKTNHRRTLGSGSCSALIKLLPGNKDLLVSHDTWNTYQAMLRIMKKYTFAFHVSPEADSVIPGNVQAFSSYPGSIFSGDDFYILSTKMVAMETTIGNSNASLWRFVTPENTVMEWMRNIIANRLAKSGKEWADIFSKFNSGTYNNQWMIIDYNFFTPGKMDIKENLFIVLEQIPGLVVYADKTEELLHRGYWASYNIPYFEQIFNLSGGVELVQKYGDWFSYDMNPRAQIFKRNQSLVTDMESMIRLMRYNNFQNDPLSKCEGCKPPFNGENAISARSDLNPANGTYPFGALKQRPHGGTDMKVTSFTLYQNYELIAISGPTWDQVPVFQWSQSPYSDLLHMGQPDRWGFPPVRVSWG